MLPNIKFNSAKKPLLSSVPFISLGLVVALSSFCVGNTIIFHSEKIIFEVHPDHCHVSGIYTLRNDSPETVRKMLYFPVKIPSKSATDITITYEQATPGKYFEYILDTTMKWHFPLVSAEFILIVSPEITLEKILPGDYLLIQNGSKSYYRIYRENFRTADNLRLQWSLK